MRSAIVLILLSLASIAVATSGYEAELSAVADGSGSGELPLVQGVKLESGLPAGMEPIDPAGRPSHGRLQIGGGYFTVLIEESGDEARLYVDRTGNGKLEPIDWETLLPDGTLACSVDLRIASEGDSTPYRFVLMWNRSTPTVLTYYSATHRIGEIGLPEREVRVAVIDGNSDGFYDDPDHDALLIDVDGDGELLATADSHERFSLSEPFNIDGTTYIVTSISPDGSHLTVDRSADHVDPKPPLLVGYPAPTFEAVDADGNPFSLTELRGGIVVLDFWAGWCTPCIEELDTLAVAAERLREGDGTLIGIDLDRSLAAFRAAVTEHEITYRQIYDGPDGPIGSLYRIGGIPMVYLIDRDGIIRGRDLRGDELIEAIDALLDLGEGGR